MGLLFIRGVCSWKIFGVASLVPSGEMGCPTISATDERIVKSNHLKVDITLNFKTILF